MQRQLNGTARDARQDANKVRDDTHDAVVDLQQRVGETERDLARVKAQMVTSEDLENAVCRIEKGVSGLARDLRSELKDAHRRVDHVYRNGHASGNER